MPEPEQTTNDERRRGYGRRLEDYVAAGVLRALADLGLGLLVVDAGSSRVIHANDALREPLGYTADDLLELPDVWTLLPPFERRQIKKHVRLESLGWTITSRYRTTMLARDGGRRSMDVSAFAFDDGKGPKFTLVVADAGPQRERVNA